MSPEYVYKVTHSGYRDPLYTAYLSKSGKRISKELAVRKIIERLKIDGNYKRAQSLRSIFYDPDLSDNRNYLTIELVNYVPHKKKESKQLEFQFGPPAPLNIKEAFKKSINEMIEADVVGIASTHGGSVGNTDFYATGDSRVPKSIFGGVVFRRSDMYRKRNKKRKKYLKLKRRIIIK